MADVKVLNASAGDDGRGGCGRGAEAAVATTAEVVMGAVVTASGAAVVVEAVEGTTARDEPGADMADTRLL